MRPDRTRVPESLGAVEAGVEGRADQAGDATGEQRY